MKVAIISDLHVGCAARGKDYCPPADIDSRAIDENYQDMFIDFILEEGISADFLLMPGDLSNRSRFTEVDLGTKIMYEIAQALGVKRDHILSVPGNHDVDWSVYRDYSGPEREARKPSRYNSLLRDSTLFINGASNNNLLFTSPHYRIWEFEEAVIVGSNSSWHDDPDSSIHHGSIVQDCIQQIEESLKDVKDFKNKLKIFLIHHHPINYSDPVYYPDHSIMHNAENLLKMLMRNSFDFLIHGHKHVPKFKNYKGEFGISSEHIMRRQFFGIARYEIIWLRK